MAAKRSSKKSKEQETKEAQIKEAKARLLNALEKTLGNISSACKMVGIARRTFYNYMEDDEFKADVQDVFESNLDFAETKLLEQVTKGNVTSIIFFLKTKGKSRGYVEGFEFTGKNGNPMEIAVDQWSSVPLQKRKALMELLDSAMNDSE